MITRIEWTQKRFCYDMITIEIIKSSQIRSKNDKKDVWMAYLCDKSIIEENRFSVFEWQWWSDSMVLIEIGISGIQFIQFDNLIEFWTWLSNGQQWNVRFDS